MKANKWLESSEFIEKIVFPDKYYLETLLFKISAFIKNAPVPIISSFDAKNKSIYLTIGENKQYFSLNVDIAYYDMITLMKVWSSQYFPKYEVTLVKQVEYTDDEIVNDLVGTRGMNLNDAILERKPVNYLERGLIEKVFIKRDEFIFNINGIRQLRLSGVPGEPLPLSKFMEGIRIFSEQKSSDQLEIKDYIENKSKLVSIIKPESEVIISYSGKQMLNFISINFEELFTSGDELVQLDDFTFVWGKFRIIFDSKILMQDCLNSYHKMVAKKYL